MILFCGSDSQILGIADAEGTWDMMVFRSHVDTCEVCRCGVSKIMGMIGGSRSPRKSAASAANGKLGGRPKKES